MKLACFFLPKRFHTRFFTDLLIFNIILFASCLITTSVFGATFYVGQGETYTSIQAGFSAMSAGDTLIIKNGIYAGSENSFTNIPNGVPGAYTTIKAENDGGAIITSTMQLAHTNSYIQIEGLKFDYSGSKVIFGNHIKVLRCSFKGGGAFGNTMQVVIGTNDYSDTEYILLEDCWAYGEGGRYNFLIYNSKYVVLRRCLVRHDGGWTDDKSDPEASFCVYNSSYVELQNCVVVDSALDDYHTYATAFYTVYNTASPNSTHHVRHLGGIIVNTSGNGHTLDGNGIVTDVIIDNSVILGTGGGGISGGQGHTVNVYNTLIGRTRNINSWKGGVGQWGSGAPTISDSIIYRVGGADIDGFSASYIDRYAVGGMGSCTNCVSYDPETSGLLYPFRIEAGSVLSSAGENGRRVGPEIIKRMGLSGTIWGESGYDLVTSENLWPWPNEDRIKADLSEVSTRGFCAQGLSLTSYLWEYLGNSVPPDIVLPRPNINNISIQSNNL